MCSVLFGSFDPKLYLCFKALSITHQRQRDVTRANSLWRSQSLWAAADGGDRIPEPPNEALENYPFYKFDLHSDWGMAVVDGPGHITGHLFAIADESHVLHNQQHHISDPVFDGHPQKSDHTFDHCVTGTQCPLRLQHVMWWWWEAHPASKTDDIMMKEWLCPQWGRSQGCGHTQAVRHCLAVLVKLKCQLKADTVLQTWYEDILVGDFQGHSCSADSQCLMAGGRTGQWLDRAMCPYLAKRFLAAVNVLTCWTGFIPARIRHVFNFNFSWKRAVWLACKGPAEKGYLLHENLMASTSIFSISSLGKVLLTAFYCCLSEQVEAVLLMQKWGRFFQYRLEGTPDFIFILHKARANFSAG